MEESQQPEAEVSEPVPLEQEQPEVLVPDPVPSEPSEVVEFFQLPIALSGQASAFSGGRVANPNSETQDTDLKTPPDVHANLDSVVTPTRLCEVRQSAASPALESIVDAKVGKPKKTHCCTV